MGAVAAGREKRFRNESAADPGAVDAFPNLLDVAGHFVTHDDGRRGLVFVLENMEVGAADPRTGGLQDDTARIGPGIGPFQQPDIAKGLATFCDAQHFRSSRLPVSVPLARRFSVQFHAEADENGLDHGRGN